MMNWNYTAHTMVGMRTMTETNRQEKNPVDHKVRHTESWMSRLVNRLFGSGRAVA